MNFQPIYTALVAHQWLIAGALVVPFLVALMKQGWVTRWLAAKLPATALPYVALALGVLTVGSTDVLAGKAWQQAVFDGLAAGVLAVFAHQTVVEGARDGKEIIPAKKPAVPPPGQGDTQPTDARASVDSPENPIIPS
jgi:hypothetical protein